MIIFLLLFGWFVGWWSLTGALRLQIQPVSIFFFRTYTIDERTHRSTSSSSSSSAIFATPLFAFHSNQQPPRPSQNRFFAEFPESNDHFSALKLSQPKTHQIRRSISILSRGNFLPQTFFRRHRRRSSEINENPKRANRE